VDFGKLALGSEREKYLPHVYAGAQSAGRLVLTVSASGTQDAPGGGFSYPARRDSRALDVQRFDLGLGLRANWFRVALSAEDGADFRLASLEFSVAATKRRVQ
jgi:hypothetical protein